MKATLIKDDNPITLREVGRPLYVYRIERANGWVSCGPAHVDPHSAKVVGIITARHTYRTT